MKMNEEEKKTMNDEVKFYLIHNICIDCVSDDECDKSCIYGKCLATRDTYNAFVAGYSVALKK